MKTYKVTFTPLEPFFFGNEKGFNYSFTNDNIDNSQTNNRNHFTNQYYIKSELLPSQSTLLGALRYHFLPVKKSNWNYTETDKKRNAEAVGAESFNPGADRTFGKIKKISPLFICKDDTALVPLPFNHINGNKIYTPFRNFKPVTTPLGELWYTDDYKAKNGISSGYMSLTDGAVVERSEIFLTETRIGINCNIDEDGFFKRDYCMLKQGYAFAAYVELDEGIDVKDGVVFLGQGKSAFLLSFTAEENTLADKVSSYLSDGVAYVLGDTFTGPEIYEKSKFSVTDIKTYRAYSRQGSRVKKGGILYKLITAGSVFIPINREEFASSVNRKSLNIIGYNEIIIK